MAPDPDIAACAGIVQKGDPDRFLAIMSGPVWLREKLFPLFAFNVEVARAPWVTQESMIAEMRLQWWLDALDEIASGSEVRRHEVTTPLARVLTSDQAQRLTALVNARQWDIYDAPFDEDDHFHRYLSDTSGLLLCIAAEIASKSDGAVMTDLISDVGVADGLARWFQAIPILENKGKRPLVDGRPEAVQQLAADARRSLKNARRNLTVGKDVKAVLRCAWQADAVLKQVERDPIRVANGDMDLGEFHKKFSLLWRSFNATW
ncbi:MAG: squalene/phytoene synthase family protein [Cognatishimia sp.]|uniref:squalene/phytoene synthase family protein n=1 Tax=Cognatishimia sp. TaxID=2211648 RepID=UPI003B8B9FEF